jgi:hypothetical protein
MERMIGYLSKSLFLSIALLSASILCWPSMSQNLSSPTSSLPMEHHPRLASS